MRRVVITAGLLLAACGDQPTAVDRSPGAQLEQAARAAGIVADPARANLIGSWARETDRMCVVPAAAGDSRNLRLGVLIDYGEGQGCVASGTARQHGDKVAVSLGGCRFDAQLDGERLSFPAELPAACDALCTGRATLSAVSVERLSASVSEAETLRAPSGKPLCTG